MHPTIISAIECPNVNERVYGIEDIATDIYLVYHIDHKLEIQTDLSGVNHIRRTNVWVIHDTSKDKIVDRSLELITAACITFSEYHKSMTAYNLPTDYQRVVWDNTIMDGYMCKGTDVVSACLTTDGVLQLDIRNKLKHMLQGVDTPIGLIRLS